MSITLDQVTKRYQGSPVVNDVSLEVGEGEFYVLLGPSGSGKSTLLRAIAGLTGVDHGRIALHGNDVTHVSARQRGVGLVFQNYALFRHMTVGENIEFALKVRRMKAAERRERRKELLRLVALEGMDDRLPTQLSGGQQQRVAVARALAHKPPVLLLDEPFGALDAKIREELRRTIRQVQRELKITTVLVTHDQEEAFALADRIGVMNLGRLLESGKPDELYARPATRFVATFLGAANLLLARQTEQGIRFGTTPVNARRVEKLDGGREQEVVAVLRPEEVELAPTRDNLRTNFIANGIVEEAVFTGALERMRVRMADGAANAHIGTHSSNGHHSPTALLDVTRTQHEQRLFPVTIGQTVAIGVRRIHVLPTPLSSYTAYGADEAACERLAQHPLLVELANRMKTRIIKRVESALAAGVATASAPVSGVAVISGGPNSAEQLQWLLQNGAGEVLVLPTHSASPQRVLIHWAEDSARRSTLAVAASLLRHVAAEAVYVGILPEGSGEAQRPFGVRTLLDARSEAQAVHGLEMRTELRFGAAAEELQRQLSDSEAPMLILGVSDPAQLRHTFGALFAAGAPYPLMVVYRPGRDSEGVSE
ncbi:ABC transporter ATP-binding protein [Steroidobacter sp. S1-65]|uniref:ABC transporter ATP-binding protein n=1 Tax=Steroidobacter gossypii TaxID=2805490 RepID=A0ABS1WTI6_9GAMM|nr:ABC transporter ATP-binding protein [Steroidobacter gossypii]MBM0104285.1 ABC transporter ATP-binding protein [Steroidobacter gossypii]